jgi:large subunit ribosomal protein L7e
MPSAPESVNKKAATMAKLAAQAKTEARAAKAGRKADKKTFIANATKYEAEYKATDAAAIAGRREAKAKGGYFVPSEPKVLLVVRIRGTIGVDPKAKKIMRLFRLLQIHNATFVKANDATLRMLKLIEPYVTYGNPSRKTIKDLIYKRGFGKVNKQRVPISENAVIQDGLESKTIRCADDLIHEIITCGPEFKEANNFLWPFKLSAPLGGFSNKTKLLHYLEGGEAGARGEQINKFIQKLL